MSIDRIQNNPFMLQGINPIGAGQAGGAGRSGGAGQTGGQTSFEKDMANFRSYLPQNNGTGDLRPKNNSQFDLMA